ncbi:GGDEF domain-containing protein [Marinomonas sp. A79]|uniref:diguanylate cyclase n=1 Tax=Marinomonas vulgaris TaxID=2823372 RepID=A0ABS5HDR1_9GAMM|nr:GGDEF domain-containing protein [Marinomonas vulgaris]MBR7889533.1 GGDEF domain-containing protein [Marinomonas vulgaris]
MRSDKEDIKQAISTLLSNFSSFDQRIFNKKQERSILTLKSKLRSGELSIHESLDEISSISQDISIAVSSAIQATYGGKSLIPSAYSEGVEKIMHADIAIATNRLSVDLDRLSTILVKENPKNDDIRAIREEVVGLKVHEGKTKFFESMDILSRLSWSMHRINDRRTEKEKEYLGNLASYLKSMANKISDSSTTNDKSSRSLSSFVKRFDGFIEELEHTGNNEVNVDTMRDQMLYQVKMMQSSMNDFINNQNRVIREQKDIIESQQAQILSMESNVATMSKNLGIAPQEMLKDNLTGVANKRGYDLHCEQLHEKWKNKQNTGPLSMIVINVDHFEKINDIHNRDVGDLIVTWLSDVIKNLGSSYKDPFFARYEEDLFVICTEGLSPFEALSLIKRIQTYVQKNPFNSSYYQVSLSLTVSIGLAFFIDEYDAPQGVFSFAVKALNQSKRKGRNQVWISRASLISEKIGPLTAGKK